MSLWNNLISQFKNVKLGPITKTIVFNSLADSGHFGMIDSNYTTAHNSATAAYIHDDHISIGQRLDTGSYVISRGMVFFNTTCIPSDATIIAATLNFSSGTDLSVTDFDVVIRNGQPNYPHVPPVLADYNYTNYSGDGGSKNTSTFSTSWSIPLNDTGIGWITKAGITKLALISSRDISSTTPTGLEEVMFDDDCTLSITYQLNTSLPSFAVTLRQLMLGSRDSWSGWRAKSWAISTGEMIIIPKAATRLAALAGVYVHLDAVGLTTDGISIGDQILDGDNNYYTVETVKNFALGGNLGYTECDLSKETMYQADAGATTWSKSRGSDPRYRQKVFLDTYLRVAQITKDNDSTQASWGVIFNDPPYPLDLEFRGSSNMNGLYVVDQPDSTPLMNPDKKAYGYEEYAPIHIVTVNSTACNGTALAWKMEAELRYICETNPLGSVRGLDRRRKNDRELGGMWLYDTEYIMSYKRDTTT